MNKKPVLINQRAGFGDIIFCQKIARKLIEKGYDVIWPVVPLYAYLSEYIPDINFATYDANMQFKAEIDQCDNIIQNGKINEFEKCYVVDVAHSNTGIGWGGMTSKYTACNLDFKDWDQYVPIKRNREREQKLLDYLNIKPGDKFALVNRSFGTPGQSSPVWVNQRVKPTTDIPIIEIKQLGFDRIFDWMGAFELATEIHTVETSFSYILHLQKIDNVTLYPRWESEHDTINNLDYCREYYTNKTWKFVK
jgi:hypothetical protein